MTHRRLACAGAAVGLALAACGSSGSSAGTASLRAFRSSFATGQRELRAFSVALDSAITRGGIRSEAQRATPQRATLLGALAARAEREASALEGLNPPTQYNTRLRVLGSALDAVAGDLSNISTAVTDHNASATESATRALRTDAANVRSADATVSKSLGLPAG